MPKETQLEAFSTYLANRSISQKTIRNYCVTIKTFLQDLNKQPEQITMDDFENEVHLMQTVRNKGKHGGDKPRGYSINSLTSKYCALASYIKYLNEKIHNNTEVLKYDHKEFLHPPPHVLTDKDLLIKDEVTRLFEFAKSNRRDLALLSLLYYSTQRKTTIAMLNWSDIDIEKHEVTYRFGLKQKKGIRIHKNNPVDAFPSLIDYRDHGRETPMPGSEDAVFLNGTGKRINPDTINDILSRYLVSAGITKHIFVHSFRSSAITIMNELGMTRDDIKTITGHQNTKSLDTYIRPDTVETNKKSRSALALDTEIPKPEPHPEPEIKKPKPQPHDTYIAKPSNKSEEIRLMELQLANKQADIEYLKLKQHQDNSIYG